MKVNNRWTGKLITRTNCRKPWILVLVAKAKIVDKQLTQIWFSRRRIKTLMATRRFRKPGL